MIRAILEEALLFLIPFAAFALFLLIRRRNPLVWTSWSNQAVWLVITGLMLGVVALLITGLSADRQRGAFEPPHMENGRLVPGQFR